MQRKAASSSPRLPHPDVLEFKRLVRSLHYPLSPEGKRVLAAAKVGRRLILDRVEEVKRAKLAVITEIHIHRKKPARAVSGGTPVCEHKLPGCIQEMLAQHRLAEKQN